MRQGWKGASRPNKRDEINKIIGEVSGVESHPQSKGRLTVVGAAAVRTAWRLGSILSERTPFLRALLAVEYPRP
jgi:hypothetical protein